jgi:transcriptional regulator with XRE-family HTH domain
VVRTSRYSMAKAKFSPAHARFRALLVKARKSAELKQVDVAERLDRSQSYFAEVEQGQRRLDIVEFVEFTRAIDADPVKLLREFIQGMDS